MDILLRMPITQKVKSPLEIQDTENRKPTAKETALWEVLQQLKGGYSGLNAVEVGVRTAKYKLLMVTVFGFTLKQMEAAIAKFGMDWHIIHAEENGKVIRAGLTTDLLAHTPDNVTYDVKGIEKSRTKATVPVIGCWAGKRWQI